MGFLFICRPQDGWVNEKYQAMKTKEQQQEYTMNLVRELKQMPDCVCGHPRIKHGVYCETSCVGNLGCGCYEYRPGSPRRLGKVLEDE